MPLFLDLAYLVAGAAAAPAIAAKSLRTGKYRSGWSSRLGFGPDFLPKRHPHTRVLLLHCVSVGELNSVTTLIHRLLAANNHLHIVITTTTDTGTQRACKLYPPTSAPGAANVRVHTTRFPLDFSFAVEHLFDRIRPDAVALVELETWPNFLAIAASRRIPVALINGRLSERSFPRYRLIRPIMQRMLKKLSWIAVQNESIAARFRALGAPADRLEILPTLKYDNAHIASTVPGQTELAAAMGLAEEHPLFVAGSTGPGEEDPILDTYLVLQKNHPALRLAIAPRHPEVVPQVLAAIKARRLIPILRTDRPDPPNLIRSLETRHSKFDTSQIFVLNTLGELRKLYALAFAAFVGRSLFKRGGGGSDMIEVAALAKPCCFGEYTSNFAEVVELLLRHQAADIIKNSADLSALLQRWLQSPQTAADMGTRAQALITQQQGSTDCYVQKLMALLERTP